MHIGQGATIGSTLTPTDILIYRYLSDNPRSMGVPIVWAEREAFPTPPQLIAAIPADFHPVYFHEIYENKKKAQFEY
jgi:hypothetical protein